MSLEFEPFEQFYKNISIPVKQRKSLSKQKLLETYGGEFIKEFNFEIHDGLSINQLITTKIRTSSNYRDFRKFVYIFDRSKSHCEIYGFRD
jgi:hypothetical protein